MKAKDLIKLIPTHIRITKDVTYEVLYNDEFLNNNNQLGECRYDTKQILIKNGQSPTELFKTFLHEVFHAISFETPNLNLTENQVLKLEDSSFRVLKLNNILEVLPKNS